MTQTAAQLAIMLIFIHDWLYDLYMMRRHQQEITERFGSFKTSVAICLGFKLAYFALLYAAGLFSCLSFQR